VQGTPGAALHSELRIDKAQLIIRKGHHRDIDSYSAFLEADRKTTTGLAGYLKERKITELFVCGLATDFCVAWSALDGRSAGFEVSVFADACRAIDLEGSLAKAWNDMSGAGVRRLNSGSGS
jgi:nicotinamidase/pyrazinamidase